MSIGSVEVAQRGQVTLPKALRDQYDIKSGQQFTVIDLGGAFLLSPKESKVEALCDQIKGELLQEGTSLEDLLAELRAMREDRTGE
ncbi:AbrB/MazE/SpoVT family DNA-binding domain-containing protein [Armatimonas sp.]|uniref:AbrB/MazE/SpoVT family DNA-binding domain-containing protein n=1 Tax=Armatimonas sp. TaxID=1872638 RepID=UPI00286B9B57|nr:AbrB/MazE/SpoVT family DNA-binding domain-containing protein [Armatimonas sp.]